MHSRSCSPPQGGRSRVVNQQMILWKNGVLTLRQQVKQSLVLPLPCVCCRPHTFFGKISPPAYYESGPGNSNIKKTPSSTSSLFLSLQLLFGGRRGGKVGKTLLIGSKEPAQSKNYNLDNILVARSSDPKKTF